MDGRGWALVTRARAGSAPPRSMIEALEARGVEVRHIWGMVGDDDARSADHRPASPRGLQTVTPATAASPGLTPAPDPSGRARARWASCGVPGQGPRCDGRGRLRRLCRGRRSRPADRAVAHRQHQYAQGHAGCCVPRGTDGAQGRRSRSIAPGAPVTGVERRRGSGGGGGRRCGGALTSAASDARGAAAAVEHGSVPPPSSEGARALPPHRRR